jgi:Cys-tRNA(Pro)/Cys-tRNA(Cys) deacylase
LGFTLADGRVVLVGIPGPARLRYGDLARALGVARSHLAQAGPDAVAALGMEPGGLAPIAPDPAVTLVVDAAVPALGRVSCGGGTPTRSLVIDVADLLRASPTVVVAEVA